MWRIVGLRKAPRRRGFREDTKTVAIGVERGPCRLPNAAPGGSRAGEPGSPRQHAVDSYRAPPGTSGGASPVGIGSARRAGDRRPVRTARPAQGLEGFGPRGSHAGPTRTAIRPRVLQREREGTKAFDVAIVRPFLEQAFAHVLRPPAGGSVPVTVRPATRLRAPPAPRSPDRHAGQAHTPHALRPLPRPEAVRHGPQHLPTSSEAPTGHLRLWMLSLS